MIVYFDTSALVKTLIEEAGSDVALELLSSSAVAATSRLTHIEVEAAIAAARRRERLDQRAAERARASWHEVRSTTRSMTLTARIAGLAGDLAHAHPLSGADAVHLASALTLGPASVVLATWDKRLWLAGRAEGLAVAPAAAPGL